MLAVELKIIKINAQINLVSFRRLCNHPRIQYSQNSGPTLL
jgi:hypothetical protein